MKKFSIKEFNDKYPDDNACLEEIFQQRYGHLETCPKCQKRTKFYKIVKRKCYSCSFCNYQLNPLADTIFHKSSTSLKNWFLAIYLFANSKNGVSAKELARHLGITYKCAWRMAKQIRLLFQNQDYDGEKLKGIVEADETYVGGKRRCGTGNSRQHKTPIIGVVEREGAIKAMVVKRTMAAHILPFICKNVAPETQLMTDEYRAYDRLSLYGYTHQTVNHTRKEYVVGNVHTNTIEGFWSQLKRSINGTYHAISPKYLQQYLNEFAFRYNLRHSETHLFRLLIPMAAKLV